MCQRVWANGSEHTIVYVWVWRAVLPHTLTFVRKTMCFWINTLLFLAGFTTDQSPYVISPTSFTWLLSGGEKALLYTKSQKHNTNAKVKYLKKAVFRRVFSVHCFLQLNLWLRGCVSVSPLSFCSRPLLSVLKPLDNFQQICKVEHKKTKNNFYHRGEHVLGFLGFFCFVLVLVFYKMLLKLFLRSLMPSRSVSVLASQYAWWPETTSTQQGPLPSSVASSTPGKTSSASTAKSSTGGSAMRKERYRKNWKRTQAEEWWLCE